MKKPIVITATGQATDVLTWVDTFALTAGDSAAATLNLYDGTSALASRIRASIKTPQGTTFTFAVGSIDGVPFEQVYATISGSGAIGFLYL